MLSGSRYKLHRPYWQQGNILNLLLEKIYILSENIFPASLTAGYFLKYSDFFQICN